jgi:tetratricopeptide (TPR) repeat protein
MRFRVWIGIPSLIGATLAVNAGCSRDPHAAMLKFAKSGDEYAAGGKRAEAIIEYRNALEKDPKAGDVRVKLAEAYLQQGEPGKAAQEYVRAADVLPDPQVQLKAGNLLLLGGRFDDAKVRAQKVLAADPKNVDAQILLANALAGLKDLNGAVAELEEAIQLNPERSATYANLGEIELGRGNREPAEKAFTRAVELAPSTAAPHLALGTFYWATARWVPAERELLEALRVEPDNPLAHRTAATFFLATNRPGNAEPHLRRVLELTKSTNAAFALADYYVSVRKESAAREILDPVSRDPKNAVAANARLAALDRSAGQADAAYKRLDGVLAADPRHLQALLLKAAFLLADGKLDDALKTANTAVDAHRDALGAYYVLGRVQAARRQPDAAIAAYQEVVRLNPLATDAKVALARLHLGAGRTDSSVGLAEEALKADPQNANARLVLVQGLIARGELSRAQTDLEALKARYPNSAAVHAQMGMLLGKKSQPVPARTEFERALQLDPASLEAVGGLVALDLSTRRFDEARARVDAISKKPDAKPVALMLAARTYAATGDLATSEQLLRRVLAADPTFLGAYGALGQIYAKQGRLDQALAEFEAMAKRDPKPVAPLTLAGMMLESQGKIAAAQEHFERAVQIDPQAAVAANNLAWIYAEHGGNLDVALQLAQTAKRQLPNAAEVNDTLGFVYYKKDLAALAVPLLRTAVEKDPTSADYLYHLGLAYGKNGEKSKAAESLTRALSLKPDFSGAHDARTVLASLGDTK